MILCLDAGNTRLKWGLRSDDAWLARGVLEHDETARLIELLPARPQRILACNVAGAAVGKRIEMLAEALAAPLGWFTSTAAACGVINGYDDPARLGADRWAALIGARSLHAGPALVVMAGTATTIDVLEADGRFRGGLILPGLELMRRSLACNTAGLPEARGIYRELPTNTDDAIDSGILHATLGAIERMAATLCRPAGADFIAPPRSQTRLAAPHGGAEVGPGRPGTDFLCLLSGGAASRLAPHIDLPLQQVDDLVLEGLARSATSSS